MRLSVRFCRETYRYRDKRDGPLAILYYYTITVEYSDSLRMVDVSPKTLNKLNFPSYISACIISKYKIMRPKDPSSPLQWAW